MYGKTITYMARLLFDFNLLCTRVTSDLLIISFGWKRFIVENQVGRLIGQPDSLESYLATSQKAF